jgi:hypothetical protein
MSLWLRLGPFSASSRGRVGVRVGPVGMYGGGRRRRRRSSSKGSGVAWLWVIGLFVMAVIVESAIKYWYVVVPFLVLGTLAAVISSQQKSRTRAEAEVARGQATKVEAEQREARVAALEKLQAARAAERAADHQAWLDGPAPPLRLPGRFTENWFATNLPSMHPGQLSPLTEELLARGWTGRRIKQRVAPYLATNPDFEAFQESGAHQAPLR